MPSNKDQFILKNNYPIGTLNCIETFNQLTEQEKLYAHFLCKSAHYGGLIAFIQSSPEAPIIFSLLHRVLSAQSIEEFKTNAMATDGVQQDDLTVTI